MHHECEIFVFFRNSFHTIFPLLSRKWTLLGISICCRHFPSSSLSLPSWPNMYYFEPLRISIQLSQQQISQGTQSFKTRKKAKLKKHFHELKTDFRLCKQYVKLKAPTTALYKSLSKVEGNHTRYRLTYRTRYSNVVKCFEDL